MTRRRLIWVAAAVLALVGLGVAAVYLRGIPGQTRPHQPVGAQAQTLREAFNADAGTVRVVALVSPTCGACLRGAADLQTGVFATIRDPKLRGYIVWVPKLDGHETNVPEATHTVADPRASHFWDADGYLVHAYDHTLHLGQHGPGTAADADDPTTHRNLSARPTSTNRLRINKIERMASGCRLWLAVGMAAVAGPPHRPATAA
jgi:hypothetical protein